MKINKEKIKNMLLTAVRFITNPRFLLCFGIAWIITNGWSYIMLGIGTYYGIKWMIAVSTAYIAFLWLPITPEKIVTVTISIFLLRLFFPNDQKTLAILKNIRNNNKNKRKEKKNRKEAEKSKSDKEFE